MNAQALFNALNSCQVKNTSTLNAEIQTVINNWGIKWDVERQGMNRELLMLSCWGSRQVQSLMPPSMLAEFVRIADAALAEYHLLRNRSSTGKKIAEAVYAE